MKKPVFMVLLTVCFLQSFAIQRIDLTNGIVSTNAADVSKPIRTVENVDDGMIVTYNFSGATLNYDNLFPGTVTFDILGFQLSSTPGEPALPRRVDSFLVPIGSEPVVSLLACEYKDLSYEIAPARFIIADNDTITYSTSNVTPIQPFSGFFPTAVCEQMPDGLYRSQPIAQIKVSPIQYDFNSKSVRVYSKLVYKIKYSGADMAAGAYYEPGSLLNPNCEIIPPMAASSFGSPNAISVDAGYLIITVPEFEDALAPFIKWKKQLGYTVTTLYNNAWTPELVKETVQEQYAKNKSLQYLLIVGDHSKVPAEDKSLPDRFPSFLTDFHYGCMDGENDIYPDVMRGRWPVRTVYELQTITDKTIWYEQSPVTQSSFYGNAIHFGYFEDDDHVEYSAVAPELKTGFPDGEEDRRFVKTCEDIAKYIQENTTIDIDKQYFSYYPGVRPRPRKWSCIHSLGEMIPNELVDDSNIWVSDSIKLINGINEGRLYILYRGHGAPNGWYLGSPDYDYMKFGAEVVSNLKNYEKMPLIFSMSCLTGNHENEMCFAKKLLTASNGGSMGVFAQTCFGLTPVNDRLSSLFFNAIWPVPGFSLDKLPLDNYWAQNPGITQTPYFSLGGMLDYSINGLIPIAGDISSEELYTKRITHCFGDPSLSFTTEVPTTFDSVDIVQDEVANTVTVDIGNEPAYISFYNPVNDHSCRYFGTSASYRCSHHDQMKHLDITVSNHNKIPHLTLGQEYLGTLSPKNRSQITGWRDIQASRVEIEFIIADADKNSNISMVIVDLSNGSIVAQTSIDKSVIDQKRTVTLFTQTGIMMASLMIDGYPQSNVKMYISR